MADGDGEQRLRVDEDSFFELVGDIDGELMIGGVEGVMFRQKLNRSDILICRKWESTRRASRGPLATAGGWPISTLITRPNPTQSQRAVFARGDCRRVPQRIYEAACRENRTQLRYVKRPQPF
jgi:hypothetical protein